MAKDEVRAVAIFRSLCNLAKPIYDVATSEQVLNLQRAVGCRLLGYAYDKGVGTQQDALQAATLLRSACDGDDTTGCVFLGERYARTKDIPRARELYALACDAKDAFGCRMLAGLYSDARDFDRGIPFAERACPEVTRGCALLGHFLCETKSAKRNPARAIQLLTKACDEADGFACSRLGITFSEGTCTSKDQLRASEFYRKGCDAEEYGACGLLGTQCLLGKGVQTDLTQARELLRTACIKDEAFRRTAAPLCNEAADLFHRASDEAEAVSLYELSCSVGNVDGGSELAQKYVAGSGVEKSGPTALALLEKACARKTPRWCKLLAPLRRLSTNCRRMTTPECEEYGFSR